MSTDDDEYSLDALPSAGDAIAAAWRATERGPRGDLERRSLLSAAHESADLLGALADEGVIGRSSLELHLVDASSPEHSMRALDLGRLLLRITSAVKETSKGALGRERYRANLLASAVSAGSFAITLASPPARTTRGHASDALPGTAVDDTDALSLERVVAVLAQSPSDGRPDQDAVRGLADALPPKARAQLARFADLVSKSNLRVAGDLIRVGREVTHFDLTAQSAVSIRDALGETSTSRDRAVMSGYIDGSRRSLLAMYFAPDGGRTIVAAVPDPELYERVVELDAPDRRVEAVFDVLESVSPADKTVVRKAYSLRSIRALPDVPELDYTS